MILVFINSFNRGGVMVQRYNNRGFTLLETILSMTLFSSVLIVFIPFATRSITMQQELENTLNLQHNTRFALNYIEKRIRECDKQQITYYPDKKSIEGKNDTYNKLWIDLSGNKRMTRNTLLYFYRSRGELRVNKNGENNVLVDGIKDIAVTEIVEGELLEIEVFASRIDYSVKTRLKLKYR